MTLSKGQKAKRKQAALATQHVVGHGNYYTEKVKPFLAQNVPKGTFRDMGSAAGMGAGNYFTKNPALATLGGQGGAFLGNALSKILGFGDYEVKSNTISKIGKAVSAGELVPDFGVRGNATRVRHREFIRDVLVPASPLAFTNASDAINAGNAALFPWLSSVAAQYQQYKFEGLVFEFKTLSSDITTGGPLGAVILATNYDVLEPAFPDKVHMENSQYAVSAKPSMSQFHTVECAPNEVAQNLYYVRDASNSLSSNADARFSDLGLFQIATSGLPGSTGQVLGELWASYDVVLYKPEIVNVNSVGTKISANTGVSRTVFFGTAPVVTGDTRIAVSSNTLTAVTIGPSLVVIAVAGAVILAPVISGTYGAASLLETSITAGGLFAIFVYRVNITAPGQTFTVDFSGSTTITANATRIAQWAYALA